jgi:hypothetical protein
VTSWGGGGRTDRDREWVRIVISCIFIFNSSLTHPHILYLYYLNFEYKIFVSYLIFLFHSFHLSFQYYLSAVLSHISTIAPSLI